jgi:hypothetical protein
MEMMETNKCSKIYNCIKCDYTTVRESQYKRHLNTQKHRVKVSFMETPKSSQIYACNLCGKEYKNRAGLWKHSKKCTGELAADSQESSKVETNDISNMITSDMVMALLTQNQEFKQLIIDQQKENQKQQKENQKQQQENQKLQTIILETESKLLEAVKESKTINTNCNNTTNNKFNLNIFLNEYCKDAMNISDFIDNMVLSVEDLKNTGKLGYIDGITKIFADKLKELDTHYRPLHCTDLKRETLYIKNNNEWSKETEDKQKMKTAIECVANKNLNNLNHWKEENPNHVIMDSNEDKEFVEIMTNSLGGMGSDREKNKQKIIKNVLKEVIVDK